MSTPLLEESEQTDTASPGADVGPAPIRRARMGEGRPIRVGVVGAGYVAQFHLDILKELPGVEAVAVCDVDRHRAEVAARRHGGARAVTDLEELARAGVDVAHVLAPPDLHVPITRRLLELGVGALVEKPLALSSAEARDLQRLAEERSLPLAVNHNNVFHPAFARLLAAARAGRIGRVEHVQATLAVPLAQLDAGQLSHWMFRAPGNIVFEQAPHPFSQVHALVGRLRRATTTILGTRELQPGQLFHDRWLVAAEAERGTAEVYLAFGPSFMRSTIQVLGSDGALEADLGHNLFAAEAKTPWLDFWNSFLAGWRRGGALRRGAVAGLVGYGRYTLGVGRRGDAYFVGMRESLTAFYRALAAGVPLPNDGAAAAEVLEWCEAAARAAAPLAARPVAAAKRPAIAAPARPTEVVVLGGTGFIGRRVVSGLLDRGLPVTAVVRRTHGLPPEISAAAEDGRVRLAPGSLEDREALAAAVRGAHTVVQLATGGGETWEEVSRSMIGGSVAAAEAALAAGVSRFVYVSSIAALYCGADGGDRRGAPIEDDLETDPQPAGRDVYSRGKMAAERALLELHRERGLPLVIVRPGVVLGRGTPMQHSGLGLWVRDNHCVGWGRGDRPLPVVAVEDVADAIVRVVAHPGEDLHGRALNLCTRTPLTAPEIVEELARATGRDIRFHPRPLWLSQALEVGKWAVKKAGRRPGVTFPSYRDLKSRALERPFTARTAREVLGWRPVEDREAFLDRAVRIHGDAR